MRVSRREWCWQVLKLRTKRTLAVVGALAILSIGLSSCQLVAPVPFLTNGIFTYNYSPTMFEASNQTQYYFWCAGGSNGDAIFMDTLSPSDQQSTPVNIYQSAQDSTELYADGCNPAIVTGDFVNPIGDGNTYTWALYFVGAPTAGSLAGDGSIFVMFSNNSGVTWTVPYMVEADPCWLSNYGLGQNLSAYNQTRTEDPTIWVFYWDQCDNDGDTPNNPVYEMAALSNGVTQTSVAPITEAGLPAVPFYASFGYDDAAGYWYAAICFQSMNLRSGERQPYDTLLYQIQGVNPTTTTSAWQLLDNIDTSLTGDEDNFTPGLLRDPFGNVNVPGHYPNITVYLAVTYPAPPPTASPSSEGGNPGPTQSTWCPANSAPATTCAAPPEEQWEITQVTWEAGSINSLSPVYNYYGSSLGTYEATTGYVEPGFSLASVGGQTTTTAGSVIPATWVYEYPYGVYQTPIYNCKGETSSGVWDDYTLSTSSNCGGSGDLVLGIIGYVGTQSDDGGPDYLCAASDGSFISNSASCGSGATDEGLLGYS